MSNAKGTAVVTGASAGIGKVYAERLAARGYDLILVARRADRLTEISAALRSKHGVSVETVVADLSNAAEIERVATALERTESISVLVNNAGTSTLGASSELRGADLAAMDILNCHALAKLSLAVLPIFKAKNSGTLVNIGSVLGFQSLPVSSVYSATKAYVYAFTRGLQQELAGTNVRVQLVLPAATATDIWELSGVPLSVLDPEVVMTVDDCVNAAIAGLDLGEEVTMPSVENVGLLKAFDEARTSLLVASQSGKPAARYVNAAQVQ
jgi:short-subunit dehydrogenase